MTHTLHREGSIESLKGDWIVLMMKARGINDQNSWLKLQEFLHLSLGYNPVNGGCTKVGTSVTIGWQKLVENIGNTKNARMALVVFDNVSDTAGFLKGLIQADLGLSVVVSGLHKEVQRMCQDMDISRHTVQHSLGVWGETELLPHPKIREIGTMCGHGFVPFKQIHNLAVDVRNGKLSLERAAKKLAKPCICGIFNTKRAQSLLQEYVACMPGE